MSFHVTIRRSLAGCLTLCFLGQIAWLDFSPAAKRSPANRSRQLLVPSYRAALSSGKRSSADQAAYWLPGIAAASGDFRPQWNVSILASRESSGFAPLLDDAARFGRAPPSSIT
jgi:cbb3-type cytochrome oxidase subunit 3